METISAAFSPKHSKPMLIVDTIGGKLFFYQLKHTLLFVN